MYGKLLGSSFSAHNVERERPNDAYLDGLIDGVWLPGGVEIVLLNGGAPTEVTTKGRENIFVMELARSSFTGLFNAVSLSPSRPGSGLIKPV